MMAAGRSVFFYRIKFHQLLTQFIVFSLRNRKLSPVYQCDLITLDRTDKFRIYKIGVCQVFCVSFKKNFYGEGNLPIVRVLYFYKLTRQSILDKHLQFIV